MKAAIFHFTLIFSFQLHAQNSSYLGWAVENALTNEEIQSSFGVVDDIKKDGCAKVVLFQTSELMLGSELKRINESENCLLGKDVEVLFFYSVEAYFVIESFKESRRKGKLVLKLVLPHASSAGQNQMFLELKYRIDAGAVECRVVSFVKKIVEIKIKEKKTGVLKYDLLK